ncbi:golgin-84-like isoform X2 [Punica granatum]|nr:golgin-84-like isoform X2 [Punica granatum]XP_031388381.1 golgin-84-like isoform X2 [Punica granatum]
MEAWQEEEAERARQGQRDAESKLSTLEVEMRKMRVDMAAMKRDAEHSRQEHMKLEKRYRELTDLLYHKQAQLEATAGEKRLQEVQVFMHLFLMMYLLHHLQDRADNFSAREVAESMGLATPNLP